MVFLPFLEQHKGEVEPVICTARTLGDEQERLKLPSLAPETSGPWLHGVSPRPQELVHAFDSRRPLPRGFVATLYETMDTLRAQFVAQEKTLRSLTIIS